MPVPARPAALLLDFGGVIIETHKRASGTAEIAAELQRMIARGGYNLTTERIAASVEAGNAALKHWKHAASRRANPLELTHREIVSEFFAGDLPDGPRALLTAEATRVLEIISRLTNDHPVRPGIPDLLAYCRDNRIPVGIVSNAHSGVSHRKILADHGILDHFAVQAYSDEVGIRKPNPDIIRLAADALGLAPEQTWYVGDTQDRDVAAGRRAGVGAVIITRSKHTNNPPFAVTHRPDAVFDDPRPLLDLLRIAVEGEAAGIPVPDGAVEPHPAEAGERDRGPAVLIDHGGVISLTRPGTDALDAFFEDLHTQLARTGRPTPSVDELRDAVADTRAELKQLKQEKLDRYRAGAAPLREVTHREFWLRVADHLPGDWQSWFHAEADDLAARYGDAKSVRTMRPGMDAFLARCTEAGVPVVVVSNTVSGRAVRAACERHGLAPHILASVCSDEIGLRKPESALFLEALTIAHADPARTIFIGDKPENDAAGAKAVGIAHRVLLTGGSTGEEKLAAALDAGTASVVTSDLTDLLPLLDTITR